MTKTAQIAMVLVSFCCLGQNTDFLFRDYNNPALLKNITATTLYTQHSIINPEFELTAHKIGSVFELWNRTFHSYYYQYGYTHYKEQEFTLSSLQKISSKVHFGVNLNLHNASSPGFNKHQSVSFDLGWSYQNNRYEIDLFMENPLNNSYVKNDIESRMIISGRYKWNSNLASILQIEESLLTSSYAQHELKYSYENSFSLSILHTFTTSQYGLRFGYNKEPFEIRTSYKSHPWANKIGFSLIYQPFNG